MPDIGLRVELAPAEIPVLPGALRCIKDGLVSTIAESTQNFLVGMENLSSWPTHLAAELLSDPQTSGGMLFGVAPGFAAAAVAELQRVGYTYARVIGTARAMPGERSSLRLLDQLMGYRNSNPESPL
jgi:selenide,water dikinase